MNQLINKGNNRIPSAGIPMPDKSIFTEGSRSINEHVLRGSSHPVFMFDHADYPDEGGIYVYTRAVKTELIDGNDIPVKDKDGQFVGGDFLPYPTKGFPTPEACNACNTVKRLYVGQLRLLAKNKLHFTSLIISKKRRQEWLNELSSVGSITLQQYFLKDIRYMNMCREMMLFIEIFLKEIGIKESVKSLAKIITTLFEYDSAYRFRLQDLANETTKEKMLKNPRREMNRLLDILKQRDARFHMHVRFASAMKLLSWILYIPKVKRAFNIALEAIDFTKIQMDEADRYHVLNWKHYNFFGESYETRVERWLKFHNNKPPMAIIITVK